MTDSGWLHVFMTGEVVRGTSDETHDDYEGGYIDPRWSMRELQDRNNAGTVLSTPLSDPNLAMDVRGVVLDYLGTGYEDNGDATIYGTAEDVDPSSGDTWTYALHFIRKYHNGHEYVEERWPDVSDILAGA